MDRKYNIVGDKQAFELGAEISGGYTDESLIAASNKGIYKRAIKEADSFGEIIIRAENGGVAVTLPDAEVLMKAEISDCRCICASKTVCRHIIAAAAVLYTLYDGKGQPAVIPQKRETPQEPKPQKKPEAAEDYLAGVRAAVTGILSKGLISCGENDCDAMTRLGLAAPSAHREIGKMCLAAAADIRLMLEKNAGFSPLRAALRLCRIYNMAQATASVSGLLFSGNEYRLMGSSDMICLGIYPHRSLSGFAGVTAALFDTEKNRWYTYTSGMSDIYEKTEKAGSLASLLKLVKAHSHWQNDVSFKMISGREIRLLAFKADSSGRISSSKETLCSLQGPLTPADIPLQAQTAAPKEAYDYFSPERKPRFAAVKAEGIASVRFDGAGQRLLYRIEGGGSFTDCETAHSEISAKAVKFIRNLEGKTLTDAYFLVRFFGDTAQAVSFIDAGGVHDFWLGE